MKLPEGYKFVSTGQSQQMADAFKGILIALAMAVMFIFFVLAAQFESYIDPFVFRQVKMQQNVMKKCSTLSLINLQF